MPLISLKFGSALGSVLFFNIYDPRSNLPETSGRICIIRWRRIAEGAKAKSRAESKRGPSIDNMTASSMMVVSPTVVMPVRTPIFIPVLSLMIILFVIIIVGVVIVTFIPAVIPSAVKPSAVKPSIEPAAISVKSYCRSARGQPEQSDDKARET